MSKKINEKIGLIGIWEFVLRDVDTGEIISKETVKNLIVNNGLERMARRLGSAVDFFNTIKIGTGTTGATNSDTALETQYASEVATTIEYEADYKFKWAKIFTFGSGVAEDITEAGLFDGSSVMFNRVVTTAKSVSEGVDLTVTVVITVGRVV